MHIHEVSQTNWHGEKGWYAQDCAFSRLNAGIQSTECWNRHILICRFSRLNTSASVDWICAQMHYFAAGLDSVDWPYWFSRLNQYNGHFLSKGCFLFTKRHVPISTAMAASFDDFSSWIVAALCHLYILQDSLTKLHAISSNLSESLLNLSLLSWLSYSQFYLSFEQDSYSTSIILHKLHIHHKEKIIGRVYIQPLISAICWAHQVKNLTILWSSVLLLRQVKSYSVV